MKECAQCKKTKSKEEYTKNKNTNDKLAPICKKCASENNRKYREKQKKKLGDDAYLRLKWENDLKRKAQKEGIPLTGMTSRELNIKMIHYSDRAFPLSMPYIEFMKEYELSVEEFFLLREKVEKGEFVIK